MRAKEPQIFTRTNIQGVPVDDVTLNAIAQDELTESVIRKYIREMLVERFPSQTPGKKNVYRGMKIRMPSSSMASQVRKLVRAGEPTGISRNELIQFVLSQLEGDSTGGSWSVSFDVATSFAGAFAATNRGKELHVILQATIDEEAGYDPQEAGEEPSMFYDEAEVRFKPGADIPLTGIYVFIKSKDEFAKQRSQYQSLMTRPENNPMMVKA